MVVGEGIRAQFTDADAADRTVVVSGTSSQEQLDSLLERRAAHPVELLVP